MPSGEMRSLLAGVTVPRATRKKGKKGSSPPRYTNLKEPFFNQGDNWKVEPCPKPRSNEVPQEDDTEVLLSHARLYVFAEQYDIQPLRKLARHKLHRTLADYKLFPRHVRYITTLPRYVYAKATETKSRTHGRCWFIRWGWKWRRL